MFRILQEGPFFLTSGSIFPETINAANAADRFGRASDLLEFGLLTFKTMNHQRKQFQRKTGK